MDYYCLDVRVNLIHHWLINITHTDRLLVKITLVDMLVENITHIHQLIVKITLVDRLPLLVGWS